MKESGALPVGRRFLVAVADSRLLDLVHGQVEPWCKSIENDRVFALERCTNNRECCLGIAVLVHESSVMFTDSPSGGLSGDSKATANFLVAHAGHRPHESTFEDIPERPTLAPELDLAIGLS